MDMVCEKNMICDNAVLSDFLESVDAFENDQRNREYELKVTEFSKKLIQPEILEAVTEYADGESNPFFYRKSSFFAVFTYYRRANMLQEMSDIVDRFGKKRDFRFNYDPILFHIKLLNDGKWGGLDEYGKLIKKFEEKLLSDVEKDVYEKFLGFLNHYVEVVASFYETNLENRLNEKKDEAQERLNRVLKYIDYCCGHDKYPKMYVNRGRILVLLEKYAEGESEIRYGISLVKSDREHDRTVADFSAYLNKLATIIAFDKTYSVMQSCVSDQNRMQEEIKKTKVENIRNLSIIASLLSFILVGVQAFQKIEDYKIVGLVMLMYVGLVVSVIGLINLIASYTVVKFREKPMVYILSILLVLAGVALFMVGITASV